MAFLSEDDLISVLIPAYNHENFVQEALRSVIAQTYKNIELIIINDGSLDDTELKIGELSDSCRRRCNRFVFKSQKNIGTCLTLNSLIKEARGKYIFILSSDDVLKPECIEKLHDAFNGYPDYGAVVCDAEIIDDLSHRIYWDKERNSVERSRAVYLTFGDFLQSYRRDVNFYSDEFGKYETLLSSNYIPIGVMYRKDILQQTGLFVPEAPLEDFYMMLQIAKLSKFKYVGEALCYYRWHRRNNIKDVNKMKDYISKTYNYEINQVLNGHNDILKDIVRRFLFCGKNKVILKIGKFLELSKRKGYYKKEFALKIFNKEFVIYKKVKNVRQVKS